MEWVGCYALHLYCKHETGDFSHDQSFPHDQIRGRKSP